MGGRLAIVAALAGCGASDEQLPPPGRDAAVLLDAPALTVDAASGLLPDLALVASLMEPSILVQEQDFRADACEIEEACVGGPGLRRLLRFTTVAANLGEGDLAFGPPHLDPRFVYSTCHGHFHMVGFAEYQLIGPGGVMLTGHKQAFCLADSLRLDPQRPSHGYHCGNQGISAGWADSYPRELPCQWIDVTGVAPGVYTLRIALDPTGLIEETDRSNNVLEIPVSF